MAKVAAGPEIERLIQLLARLPGLGPRSARRAALHLVKKKEQLLEPLTAALAGLCRTALSDYSKVRRELGFATYREAEFIAILAEAGFRAERVQPNFGHNQNRMTFRAVRA